MQRLDIDTAEDFLRSARWIGRGEEAFIHALPGGRASQLFYVRRPRRGARDFVVKQALTGPNEPEADAVERGRREAAGARAWWRAALPLDLEIETPRVYCEDPSRGAVAITAAAPRHETWAGRLRRKPLGAADEATARALGRLIGAVHAAAWRDPQPAGPLDNRVFRRMRLDPLVGQAAVGSAAVRRAVETLAAENPEHRQTLVHGDLVPENVLVWEDQRMLVDYETAHWGDPACDPGMLLASLVAASVRRPSEAEAMLGLADAFWAAYWSALGRPAGWEETLPERALRWAAAWAWPAVGEGDRAGGVKRWLAAALECPAGGWLQWRARWREALAAD